MQIIVLIKQVPDIKNVKIDKTTGTIIRKGVESVINPLDLFAIETALQLKDSLSDVKVTVISMGPLSAVKAVREAIAMGCDEGIVLSDKAFAGSDTWATSIILSKAISKIGNFDIILCGERAIDGDTGQVGPEIASCLNIPVATYISDLKYNGNNCTLLRRVENGIEKITVMLPALVTVIKEINSPRLPTFKGKKKAKIKDIRIWNAEKLNIEKDNTGLKVSPTKVVKIFTPDITRKCKIIKIKKYDDIIKATNAVIKLYKD
ncbi:MAG: electron transfer flavoprotein subunit beta/FixA family protein [Victivallales bacterium]|nr:electron transfer flavoprotein subunit beta/FixA family protein [Victivallales bacterium]